MSDTPTTPFIWENTELPPASCVESRLFCELTPPPGYMLHSWVVSPIGGLVVCWVRMHRDLSSELALKLLDATASKGAR